jgi:ADP-heptose:LPS heptosyltransferase
VGETLGEMRQTLLNLTHHEIDFIITTTVSWTQQQLRTMANESLTAKYVSQTSTGELFSHELPACPEEPSTEQRTAHLSSLRSNVIKLQSQVNVFLTKKMEDQAVADAAGKASAKEKEEEENYGEEIIDG